MRSQVLQHGMRRSRATAGAVPAAGQNGQCNRVLQQPQEAVAAGRAALPRCRCGHAANAPAAAARPAASAAPAAAGPAT
eukprot:8469479-Lingulodinium_polyedra.AAC.1